MPHFRKQTLLFHALGWLIFVSLPLLFVSRGEVDDALLSRLVSWEFWLFLLTYALVFYLNYFVLIPRLLFRRRYLAYILVFGAGLFLVGWQKPFENLIIHNEKADRNLGSSPRIERLRLENPGHRPRHRPLLDIISIMLYLMTWAIGLAIAIAQRSQQNEQRAIKAETDKARAELSSLKAQINPHFLFNTLNTIYTLARLNHPSCAESVMKLSNIMRYVSDEVQEDFVPLADEVDCLRQYIELQQLRLNQKTTVTFKTSGDLDSPKIPPLILMTLVENVFKHGVSNREESVIEVSVVADDDRISFYSKNRIFQNSPESGRTGIGLANVRQRLEHLYPNRHTLRIENSGDFFVVNLEINTKDVGLWMSDAGLV